MTRELTIHKVNGLNEAIKIKVLDEPGQGNACHHYEMEVTDENGVGIAYSVRFQNGPIKEAGVNGVSNEALLAIVEDRLNGFQSGQFSCMENHIALDHVRQALKALKGRTQRRIFEGKEGTHTP